jgi:hypothetical protein
MAQMAGEQEQAVIDAPVRRWLAEHALPGRQIEKAQSLPGGHNNHNILIVTDASEQFVLRRYLHRRS